MKLRAPAVAGTFYPASPTVLRTEIDRLLAAVAPPAVKDPRALKALIVPHAGYIYSGPIAASAYAQLRSMTHSVRRVILLGPAHRVPFYGVALPDVERFATPLGDVEIDAEAAAIARGLPEVSDSLLAHAAEHSLEVQVPFLQCALGDFKLVPLVVGDASGRIVAALLDALWGGAETLIVVSSDLSHYHTYATAQQIDRGTADDILDLDATLEPERACGATPINGLLIAARNRGLRPELLDLRNSGDTAGDRGRVVGYAAFAFRESASHAGH